jgi:hypothetical protein
MVKAFSGRQNSNVVPGAWLPAIRQRNLERDQENVRTLDDYRADKGTTVDAVK